jgi:hypothetical protein
MNEKEAREIVKRYDTQQTSTMSVYEALIRAKGYLEAIEKAKVLEEALENIRCETFLDRIPAYNRNLTQEDMVRLADKAIAKWEKEK